MVFFAFGSVPILKLLLHTDYPLVVVSSESMVPTINKGDILIIKWKDPAEIVAGSHTEKTGDVLLYDTNGLWDRPADYPVVHRVVGKEYDNVTGEYTFITQGDANSYTDPPSYPDREIPIPEGNVIGVVSGRIPKLGWIKIGMEGLPGFSMLFLIGLGVLLIVSIISEIINPKKEESEQNDPKNQPQSLNDVKEIQDEHIESDSDSFSN